MYFGSDLWKQDLKFHLTFTLVLPIIYFYECFLVKQDQKCSQSSISPFQVKSKVLPTAYKVNTANIWDSGQTTTPH